MSPELLGALVVVACSPVVLMIAVVGIAWTITRGSRVAASPRIEALDKGAEGAQADHRAAADALHELPARRHLGHEVAGRAPGGRDARWADDDRELRARACVVPVVSEALQPGGGWQAGRGRDEQRARIAAVVNLGEHRLRRAAVVNGR